MPLSSLLNLPSNKREAYGFVFDHDRAHRSMFMELHPSGALPSILDPAPLSATLQRAGAWHSNHQNGHDDFNLAILGYLTPQNMADATFADKSSLSWWTFVNHHEHYLIDQTIPGRSPPR